VCGSGDSSAVESVEVWGIQLDLASGRGLEQGLARWLEGWWWAGARADPMEPQWGPTLAPAWARGWAEASARLLVAELGVAMARASVVVSGPTMGSGLAFWSGVESGAAWDQTLE